MLAIYDWFGYDLPIAQRYVKIKEAGFDSVLLWWSDGFGRGDGYRSGPELARKAGLQVENIHTPVQMQNDLWLDNLAGQALLDCYLQCIRDCASHEIPTMVVHLPDDSCPAGSLGLARVTRLAQLAEKLNVNIAMENLHNRNNLIHVLTHVENPRIGFCYDCGHHLRFYPGWDVLEQYGSRMMAMHLHDMGGERLQHQLPFDGPIRWEAVMQNIARAGFTGATALEPMNWDYTQWTPERFLQEAAERAGWLHAMRESKK